ncbi:kielin/chordin-like protein isoform X2 [Antedon mediterranea]|uniref:kielin/chordin-like protein isoform X2 n=1 Tax=Antedon mediterranea TaxID=105859 RepID=UPI003AF9B3D1
MDLRHVCFVFSVMILVLETQGITADRDRLKGTDLLQELRMDHDIPGITEHEAFHNGATVWRARSQLRILLLPEHDLQYLREEISTSFSIFFIAKQNKDTSGTLFSVVSKQRKTFLSLSSDSKLGNMTLKYRIKGDSHIQETVMPTPLKDPKQWNYGLLVVNNDKVILYSGCQDVMRFTLKGKIAFNPPQTSWMFISQGSIGNDKFLGWWEELRIYPTSISSPPWQCHGNQVERLSQDSPGVGTSGDNSRTAEQKQMDDMISHVDQLSGIITTLSQQITQCEQELMFSSRCECGEQECVVNLQRYHNGQVWQQDPCTACVCENGLVTCSVLFDKLECRDPCSLNPCLNGGTCAGYPGYRNYTCTCPPDCSGAHCELRVSFCSSAPTVGQCDVFVPRFYYNMYGQRCEEFSGCDGNHKNNFYSKAACENLCMRGACCQRFYTRGRGGSTYRAFNIVEEGVKCQETTLEQCKAIATFNPSRERVSEVIAFHVGHSCSGGICELSKKCSLGNSSYEIGQRFRSGCEECQCLTEGVINCRCTKFVVRKEIRDMTTAEIERFQQAVQVLRSSGPGNEWEQYRDLYSRHIMHAHSTQFYLLWHRVFLRTVERRLQEIDCSVALPYFDFTTDVQNFSRAVIWQPNYFGGDGQGDCLPDHPFRDFSAWDPCIIRNFQSHISLPTKVDIARALVNSDFDSFTKSIQMYAGYVFAFTGGQMSSALAPYDPLFFALQSYVDMLYWRWQQLHGVEIYPQFLRNVKMVPFNLRPTDTFDLEGRLCVTYALPTFGDPCNITEPLFNSEGFDTAGFDRNGFNRDGYNRFGFNIYGYDRNGRQDRRDIYIYDGYDFEGYDRTGYDRRGFNRYGYERNGFNRDGYDVNGYDNYGYNRYGYDQSGFDRRGYNQYGYNRNNEPDMTNFYKNAGFSDYCLNRLGVNQAGFDQFGFTLQGYNQEFCSYSFNGPHSLWISYRLDQILFSQTFQFLETIERVCPPLSQLPDIWFQQTWTTQQKVVSVVQGSIARFPASVFTSSFCFEVETLLTNCVCEDSYATCSFNPCNVNSNGCHLYPAAVCVVDVCGGCNAMWFDNDQIVDCEGQFLPEDRCILDGREYRHGETWKADSCTTCTCQRKNVSCVTEPCPTVFSCSHPGKRPDECCSYCKDCMYQGFLIKNGADVVLDIDSCESCLCQEGNVRCTTRPCPPVDCESPKTPRGGCCPICDGCDFNGIRMHDGESIAQGECDTCTCMGGNVTCAKLCPELLCTDQYIPVGNCCPQCRNGCEYEGMMFSNGDFFTPMSNPCLRCSCMDSLVRCNPTKCEDPGCDNPVRILGSCCETCSDKCVDNGRIYEDGQTWISADQCNECTCQGSEVICQKAQSCRQRCDNGYIAPGQCCSDCIDCLYDDMRVSNSQYFTPPSDPCQQCLCSYGVVRCQKRGCPEVTCRVPEMPPGECCPVCPDCSDQFGGLHPEGSSWIPSHDMCQNCSCFNGRVNCDIIECNVMCENPTFKSEQCCPVCEGCLYNDIELANGESVTGPSGPCEVCVCRGQTVSCGEMQCSDTACLQPGTLPNECCPVCDGCFHDDQQYANRERFQSSSCQDCVCRRGNIECQELVCPVVTCDYPIKLQGECCPHCDGCEYNGMQYRNGEIFADDVPCRQCRCDNGGVRCSRIPCQSIPCQYPVTPPGGCCPECTGCEYNGRTYRNGDSFKGRDPCELCYCRDGEVGNCQKIGCRVTNCLNPVQRPGMCCPCDEGCEIEGRSYSESETIPRDDPCETCTCEQGSMSCVKQVCRPADCSFPQQDNRICCADCLRGCTFDGNNYNNGDSVRRGNCETCMCMEGELICKNVTCPIIDCQNPTFLPGSCCPRCDDCEVDGTYYANGEKIPTSNYCESCYCISGQRQCSQIDCPDLACTHPGRVINQCCSVCGPCEYGRRNYDNGAQFTHPDDQCRMCICQDGTVTCQPITCAPVNCQNPVTRDGECCEICQDCNYGGNVYMDGDIFQSPLDPCEVCLCMSGSTQCQRQTCPPTPCSHPYTEKDSCCSMCDHCFYDNQLITNGQVFTDSAGVCRRCVSGSVESKQCPPLTCRRPIRIEGECCEVCPDIQCDYGGQTFQSGERFQNPFDDCEMCLCINGQVSDCAQKPCAEPTCRFPVMEECCYVCDGCSYHGIEIENRRSFEDPFDQCRQCVCLDGEVECQNRPCSPVSCSGSVVPKIPEGECCPRCIDCTYGGRVYRNGESFPNPRNNCNTCLCLVGYVECQALPCPPSNCDYPLTGGCCSTCDGCNYKNVDLRDGQVIEDPSNKCTMCICSRGNIECEPTRCPTLTCRNQQKLPGDCCDTCIDDYPCVVLGVQFPSGEVIPHPNNPCELCSCDNGLMTINIEPCPVTNCPYPLRGECCLTCEEGCTYAGNNYVTGTSFSSDNSDPCQICTCSRGFVTCKRKTCPPVQCFHAVEQPGECCPVCSDCSYEGREYRNGATFNDTLDTCRQCRCLNGNVKCATKQCLPAMCTHPATDRCGCRECSDCMMDEVFARTGQIFENPNDRCQDCLCLAGYIRCTNRQCPTLSSMCLDPIMLPGECCPSCRKMGCIDRQELNPCEECDCINGQWSCSRRECPTPQCPHPGLGRCCMECDECTYNGKPWANGDEFPDPADGCRSCLCVNGIVTCSDPVCDVPKCRNPIIPAGQCCPVCIGTCVIDDLVVDDGDSYVPASDPCASCTCRNGQVFCETIQCQQYCTHPQLQPGQCCPNCLDCNYNGIFYRNNAVFVPQNNNCQECICQTGNVICDQVQCPLLPCPNPINVPNQCCQICPVCLFRGYEYLDGASWLVESDSCTQCECIGTTVSCGKLECQEADCSHPVPGACCPLCESCLFEETIYNNGENFRPDDCRDCICTAGNVQCIEQTCAPLTCLDRIHVWGECCEKCRGCVYDNIEYASGKSWQSTSNPCLSCNCHEGTTMCTELQCIIPDFCTNPVMVEDQCCPICPGCEIGGLTYNEGDRFQPSSDPCETCYCMNGLTCYREPCPSLIDCPSQNIVQPAPGECCPSCNAAASLSFNCSIHNIGIEIKPFGNKCYTCTCAEIGRWDCRMQMCPALDCPLREQIQDPGDCCPRCEVCYVGDHDNPLVYMNGETWKDPRNICATCTCNAGSITCEMDQCRPIKCGEGFVEFRPEGACCSMCRASEVPCNFDGMLYQPGEQWKRDECTSCLCNEGQTRCVRTKCRQLRCEADEILFLAPGECCPMCMTRPGTCIAFGDPHYRTFDNKIIHFQGDCRYIMAMDCENEDFVVEVKNDNRGQNGVSWTDEVTVMIGGHEVEIGQGGVVKVDGFNVMLPHLVVPHFSVEVQNNNFFVTTNIGLKILWDGRSYLEVSVPGSYAKKMCGLCGNFNGYHQDDLKLRSGRISSSVAEFGNSWKTEDYNNGNCEVEDVDPCASASYMARKMANAKCSILKSPRFAKCHVSIPPEEYFASCVYDLCACGSSDTCLCDALSAYAAECRQIGINLNWRSESLCAINCPEERGFVFDECGPACPKTCSNKDLPMSAINDRCLRPCVPGCNCPAGRVLNNGSCIKPEKCPVFRGNATIVEEPQRMNSG